MRGPETCPGLRVVGAFPGHRGIESLKGTGSGGLHPQDKGKEALKDTGTLHRPPHLILGYAPRVVPCIHMEAIRQTREGLAEL